MDARETAERIAVKYADGPLRVMLAADIEMALTAFAREADRPASEVTRAAEEVLRLEALPETTGRTAARLRHAWSKHIVWCKPCARWAKADAKAPAGKIAAATECAQSDLLFTAASEAEKAHAVAEKMRREALPLLARAILAGQGAGLTEEERESAEWLHDHYKGAYSKAAGHVGVLVALVRRLIAGAK